MYRLTALLLAALVTFAVFPMENVGTEDHFSPGLHVVNLYPVYRYDFTAVGYDWTHYFWSRWDDFYELVQRVDLTVCLVLFNCSGTSSTLFIKLPAATTYFIKTPYAGETTVCIPGTHTVGATEEWGLVGKLVPLLRDGKWNLTDGLIVYRPRGSMSLGDAMLSFTWVVREESGGSEMAFTSRPASGWVLWSPGRETNMTAMDLCDANPGIQLIVRWNTTTHRYNSYLPLAPPEMRALMNFPLEAGAGYWVYATAEFTWYINLSRPPSVVKLSEGWNLISTPLIVNASTFMELYVKNCTPLSLHKWTGSKWLSYVKGIPLSNDFTMDAFEGYWLYVSGDEGYLQFPYLN